ncbi:MAG: PAS domain-containing protein, partial [Nitrospirales bacterium]|nr:PAS domain-containing protein [Nitrospirales bacterium]
RDVVYTLSPEGVIMSLNPAFETFTGWMRAAWIGRPLRDLIHPDDLPLKLQKFQGTLGGAALPLIECRILTRSGEYKVVECLETREGTNDRVVGVLGIARDITDRRRAEQTLREREQQFRQVVENIREVFWMSDPSKEMMLYISPGYQEIWGRTCESLYASPRSWLDWIYPDDQRRIFEASHTKQMDGSYNEEYRIVRPDGSIRWIHDRAFPIRDDFGTVYRIAGIAEDITERKILQDKVRDSNQALGSLAVRLQTIREDERTRISLDLHDQLGQALVTSKFYLQWMDQALSAGNFSHVLPVWQSRLKAVIQEMDMTLAAVQKICFDLRPAELDQLGLGPALERQVQEFASRTGISCETEVHVDDRRMTTEQATALFRVLQEALTNIARHAAATHVDVHLTEENGQARLQVQDDGIGIQESKIHDENSLGLLGMRERLRPLNGQLHIAVSQGKGTTLVVLLPLST